MRTHCCDRLSQIPMGFHRNHGSIWFRWILSTEFKPNWIKYRLIFSVCMLSFREAQTKAAQHALPTRFDRFRRGKNKNNTSSVRRCECYEFRNDNVHVSSACYILNKLFAVNLIRDPKIMVLIFRYSFFYLFNLPSIKDIEFHLQLKYCCRSARCWRFSWDVFVSSSHAKRVHRSNWMNTRPRTRAHAALRTRMWNHIERGQRSGEGRKKEWKQIFDIIVVSSVRAKCTITRLHVHMKNVRVLLLVLEKCTSKRINMISLGKREISREADRGVRDSLVPAQTALCHARASFPLHFCFCFTWIYLFMKKDTDAGAIIVSYAHRSICVCMQECDFDPPIFISRNKNEEMLLRCVCL